MLANTLYTKGKKIILDTILQFSSVHSVVSDSDPMDHSMLGLLSVTNSWSLPKLMSIASVMPSDHLILCHPLLLLPSVFPSIRVFSNESVLCRWPKYQSFSFNISPCNEHSGLISFQDGVVGSPCSPRDSQESSSSSQFKSIYSLALSILYSPTLTSYMTTGKTTALTRWTFVDKVMSLLFNMLSRFITFPPRSKHLLISWLQSPSAVISEPPPQYNLPRFPLFPHLFAIK